MKIKGRGNPLDCPYYGIGIPIPYERMGNYINNKQRKSFTSKFPLSRISFYELLATMLKLIVFKIVGLKWK